MNFMKVMRLSGSTQPSSLVAETAPIPTPKTGEVLIRVHAAGVTPTELLWYPTTHSRSGDPRTGAIPGHEFSGVIEAVGEGVTPDQIGREVSGMNDWFADGATAEYCSSVSTSVAIKPVHLTHAEAAAVPIGALTAWQGLYDRAQLRSGERVLIHGGSGAVGMFALQLARRAGAHVITTASPRNFDFLHQLGAHEVIDYHTELLDEKISGLDVVFDTVGGETLRRSWALLKPGGRMVTIAAKSEGAKDERIEKAFFIVEPNHRQLTEIAHLLHSSQLKCAVDAVVPFEKASDAYAGLIPGRRGRGKVVISIRP